MMYKAEDRVDQFKVRTFFKSMLQMKKALKDHAIKGVFKIRRVRFE